MQLFRHPAFGTGIVLLVLGLGNWLVARNRLTEFAEAKAKHQLVGTPGHYAEFPELTARTNAELLRPLQRGVNSTVSIEVRVDFYEVVRVGGTFLTFAGILLVLFASATVWRVRRDALVPTGPH